MDIGSNFLTSNFTNERANALNLRELNSREVAPNVQKAAQVVFADGETMSVERFEQQRQALIETARAVLKANAQAAVANYDIDYLSQKSGDIRQIYGSGSLARALDRSVLLSAREDEGKERFFSGVFDAEFDRPVTVMTPEGPKEFPRNHYMASVSTKRQNLNDYARDKYLTTRYGEVRVFLDLGALGSSELESNEDFFGLDDNGDGVVDGWDENFKYLKARAYDKDGNEKIVNLSELVSKVELKDFISDKIVNYNMKNIEAYNEAQKRLDMPNPIDTRDFDYRITEYASNPYTLFKAEYRYKKVDKTALKSFFETNANAQGWVDLRRNKIFNAKSEFKNFAYAKADFSGNLRLSEFRPIVQTDKNLDENFSYTEHQKRNFLKFYEAYQREKNAAETETSRLASQLESYGAFDENELGSQLKMAKSPTLRAMEKEFELATGLKFSEANLAKIAREFRSNPEKSAQLLADSDSVIMMRLNADGSVTLKFDSGREVNTTEIYTDTGKLTGKNAFEDYEAPPAQINVTRAKSQRPAAQNSASEPAFKEYGKISIEKLAENKFYVYAAKTTNLSKQDLYNISYANELLNGKKRPKFGAWRYFRKVDTTA